MMTAASLGFLKPIQCIHLRKLLDKRLGMIIQLLEIGRQFQIIIVDVSWIELVDPIHDPHRILQDEHALALDADLRFFLLGDVGLQEFDQKYDYMSNLLVQNVDAAHVLFGVDFV